MKRQMIICLSGIIISAAGAACAKEADCSVARDPRRCEALQAAREACSGLQGQARSACIREAVPPPDCSQAPNNLQCQKHREAMAACQDKQGKAHRQCLREKTRGN